jgi:hypothetical protein
LDIDEALLRQLEQQARQQGKSLGALLELALRGFVRSSTVEPPVAPQTEASVGLPNDDPFFSALEEVRALGRVAASRRQVTPPMTGCVPARHQHR